MTVLGIPEALAALERRKIQAEIAESIAAKAGGEIVAADMRARMPKDTGRMAASVVVEVDGDTAHTGPTVPYARFPNFGTRYMEGQRFMEEAAEDTDTGVVAAMAAIFKIAMR